jgi:leader peptidase (prepilin peptidase)/N-methyltransferase
MLRGRCRTCGATIRPLDFCLEVAFALAVPSIFVQLGPGLTAARALVALPLLVVGALVDLQERRLPLTVTGTLLFLGLLLADPATWSVAQLVAATGVTWVVLDGSESGNGAWRWVGRFAVLAALAASPLFLQHVLCALLAAGAFALLDHIYCRFRHVEVAIGGGDIRLVAGIAALTGARGIAPAIFIAALLGSVVGLGMVAVGRGNMRSQLPFGPFLAIGCMTVLLWGASMERLLSLL